MHRIIIHNFGPIRDAQVELSRFLLLIGPQSSGKSTIAKLAYFFLHVRDEVTAFILDTAETGEKKDMAWRLKKRLTNRFVEFWGPTPQPSDVNITFFYSHDCTLDISLDKQYHKYVSSRFSECLWSQIKPLVDSAQSRLRDKKQGPMFPSALGRLAYDQERTTLLEQIRSECNRIFHYPKGLFFIPAGRSLLSPLSDQIQYVHPHLLDYPMRQFVETVNNNRVLFDRSLDDIISGRQALSEKRLWFSAVRRARAYVRKILKGEYRYDKEGGKLFITPETYTKMNYASSGQQEAAWILLSLFLLVLDKAETLVFIEEPEAHLFSDAQKDIIEFISFVFNAIECDFIITTHSPYILSCINNLLLAKQLSGASAGVGVEKIISKDLWLDPNEVSGYFVNGGRVTPIMDRKMGVIKSELVDSASDQINKEYEELLALEQEISNRAR